MSDGVISESDWRRQERALAAAVIIWAVGVSALATLRPEAVAVWLLSKKPWTVAGVIMVSIGLLGGICDGALLLASRWADSSEPDLTEWNDVE